MRGPILFLCYMAVFGLSEAAAGACQIKKGGGVRFLTPTADSIPFLCYMAVFGLSEAAAGAGQIKKKRKRSFTHPNTNC